MGNKIHDEEQNRIKFYLQLIENKSCSSVIRENMI